jgi:uncharacterized membrane protein YedE/YeeE
MVSPTIVPALAGGALIGLSASLLLVVVRRVAGISSIVGGLFAPAHKDDARWRIAFILGLLAGGSILLAVRPQVFASTFPSPLRVVIAGLLVGAGTTLGRGCTSGHGVCGISRLSKRSIVATCMFMAAGMVTTFLAGSR